LEVKQVETASPEGGAGNSLANSGIPRKSPFFVRPLDRHDLGTALNWVLRGGVLAIALYLLIVANSAQWRGAFTFGFGFAGVAIGVFLTFRVLSFPDLTIEGSYATGGCVAAALIVNQQNTIWGNPWVATLIATLCGGLAGTLTGFLHTRFKINGLLAGILVGAALYSLNLRAMTTSFLAINIQAKPLTLLDQITTTFSGQPNPLLVERATADFLQMGFFALVALLCILLMNWYLNTQVGLALRATGDNENMIRALGVNTDRAKITVLTISNAFFGLTGALIAQYSRNGSVTMGLGMIIIGLAAVIIGEAFLPPRSMLLALIGALIGSLVYSFIASSVFNLVLTQGGVLRFGLTILVVALLSYLAYLTINNQTPAWVTLLCALLAALLATFLSAAAYYMLLDMFGTGIETTQVIKFEPGDIRISLALLVFLAMSIPGLRRSLGLKAAVAK
jgi:putative tryptophan/tyrosine transport system permease protein